MSQLGRIKVTTTSGSVYIINHIANTWERVNENPEHQQFVRNEDGETGDAKTGASFVDLIGPKVGESMIILGPPLVEHAQGRMITTTPVASIEPLSDEES